MDDEPVLSPREQRWQLVTLAAICALLALLAWLPRCSPHPAPKPPPHSETGPWRVVVAADDEDVGF